MKKKQKNKEDEKKTELLSKSREDFGMEFSGDLNAAKIYDLISSDKPKNKGSGHIVAGPFILFIY
ncbi:hypothetical protein [Peribacillus psychrosaccharolyticus]|uniref:hypothetical protein n=1 Tax=Peribacillus psychrosaccharolyticus TaxID=1407 RepID=UPI0003085CF8|nr:hypothetical protein [Peribacillus psychrosaccharolyticus]